VHVPCVPRRLSVESDPPRISKHGGSFGVMTKPSANYSE